MRKFILAPCYTFRAPKHWQELYNVSSTSITIAADLSCLIQQPLTGVGYYTLHLFERFLNDHRDFDVRLFASSAQQSPTILEELGAAASQLATARIPARLKTLLWTTLDWPPIQHFTGPVDLVHGAFHLLPPSKKSPRIVTIFDLSALRYPETCTPATLRLLKRLLRHAVPRADAFIAISESCKADLIELLDVYDEQVHVVYGGINLEEFSSESVEGDIEAVKSKHRITGDYFIHLGTIEPRKNLPRLLEAYARVRSRHPDCPNLVLAGGKGWLYETTFDAITRYKLHDAVIHTGYLSRSEALVLLRGAFACVYPSLYEGFGLPVLEAMASHVPVITSNVSSLPEVIGDAGIQVTPESIDEIEGALENVLQHEGNARSRCAAAYDRAQQFTWEKSADALASVYRAVAEGAA